ncbi:WD40-repeat-containing domain protein [Pisolithus marmoratus]|nr:WD40-repeat-containing domain protein [Pisolithus marmoratus]
MDDTVLFRAESELVITEARKQKADRTKLLGSPIQLGGKAIDVIVEGNTIWIAENTHVAKKIDLESGKILQIYRGHTAPVTCLGFYRDDHDTRGLQVLITGSWDKTIKIWDTSSKELLCSIGAHDDFVKSLLVVPSLRLLVSSSSDKTVRFWDLTGVVERKTITPVGSVSAHSRPVECLAGSVVSDTEVMLFTGDTMGVIKVWKLEKGCGLQPRWHNTLLDTLNLHRTRVTQMIYGAGQLWTASLDETVQITTYPPDPTVSKLVPPLTHPLPVRALLPLSLTPLAEPYVVSAYGDVIRLYDILAVFEPEVVGEIDGHWHDVTAIRLWLRSSHNVAGRIKIEPFIVSASLDGTVRKWQLSELLTSTPGNPAEPIHPVVFSPVPEPRGDGTTGELTEEEERELAELMED